MEVQDDFHLATAADIVADPSAPNAYVKGIMENVDWVYDAARGTWSEQIIEDQKKEVHKMTKEQILERQLGLWEQFVSSLRVI